MKLESIKIKLPKSTKALENSFRNCEKRDKFVKDTPNHYKKRLEKSKHDLSRAVAEFSDECWDWTIVKAYYSIFHSANALLSKKMDVFSKDHTCLMIALKYWNLVDKRLFSRLVGIYERFSDIMSMDLTFQLRKLSQYDVDYWHEITKSDAFKVLELAKEFVKYVEGEIVD